MRDADIEFRGPEPSGLHEVTWAVLLDFADAPSLCVTWRQDALGNPNRLAVVDAATILDVDTVFASASRSSIPLPISPREREPRHAIGGYAETSSTCGAPVRFRIWRRFTAFKRRPHKASQSLALQPACRSRISPGRLGSATRRSDAYRDGTLTRWKSVACRRVCRRTSAIFLGSVTTHLASIDKTRKPWQKGQWSSIICQWGADARRGRAGRSLRRRRRRIVRSLSSAAGRKVRYVDAPAFAQRLFARFILTLRCSTETEAS